MKINIDTTEKIITLDGHVKLSELFDTLDSLLPKDRWREFTLERGEINDLSPLYPNVIPLQKYPFPDIPYVPNTPFWDTRPWITCSNGLENTSHGYGLVTGSYTIAVP